MTDKNEALKAEAEKYKQSTANKMNIEFNAWLNGATSESAKSYHSEPLIKEIETLKERIYNLEDRLLVRFEETEALKKENEKCKELANVQFKRWQERNENLQSELTDLKSQNEPLKEGVEKMLYDFLIHYDLHKDIYKNWQPKEITSTYIKNWLLSNPQFKQSQEGKQVDVVKESCPRCVYLLPDESCICWKQQEPLPRIVSIRNKFESFVRDKELPYSDGSDVAIWNFFLPFLQSGEGREIDRYHANELKKAFTEIHKLKEALEKTEGREIEFADWIEDKAIHRHEKHTMKPHISEAKEWENNDWCILWAVGKRQFVKDTSQLYQEWKKNKD